MLRVVRVGPQLISQTPSGIDFDDRKFAKKRNMLKKTTSAKFSMQPMTVSKPEEMEWSESSADESSSDDEDVENKEEKSDEKKEVEDDNEAKKGEGEEGEEGEEEEEEEYSWTLDDDEREIKQTEGE